MIIAVTAFMIVFVLSAVYLVYNYLRMQKITVTEYTLRDSRIKDKIRIVQLTDLHLKEYGEFNENLARRIKEQTPDLIVITGDMCTRVYREYTPVTQLLEEAVKIAPVYYSMGNHEIAYRRQYGNELFQEIEKTGTLILDNEIAGVSIKNTQLCFLGLSVFKPFFPGDENSPKFKEEIRLLNDFSKTEGFKILLCHHPEYAPWYFSGKYDRYFKCGFDLMLSGHAHGGLVRIPLAGGLVAPKQGLFPKYDKGMYDFKGFRLIVSAGLGDTGYFFRINNPPEIAVIDLLPIQQS